MDKKKLIGTIIGVAMFAALIAGATFAFLTFTANVTNATYNGTSMNFLVDYTKGTDITLLPQLITGTPEKAASLVVKASKHNNSVDGNVTIKLSTTSSNSLTLGKVDNASVGGIINWALCKGECTTNFTAAKATGKITAGGTTSAPNTINLWTDDELIKVSPGTSYYVYFWIDASKIDNEHIDQTYSGYIHASATQITE